MGRVHAQGYSRLRHHYPQLAGFPELVAIADDVPGRAADAARQFGAGSALFLNARYGYDTRCEVVIEAGASALTLPTHVVTDAERRRAVDYPADWIPRYGDAYRIEL